MPTPLEGVAKKTKAEQPKTKKKKKKCTESSLLLKLPAELLEVICSHLYFPSIAGDERSFYLENLSRASLICRAFRKPAQHWLFRHIRIRLVDHDIEDYHAFLGRMISRLVGISNASFPVRHLTMVPGECNASLSTSLMVPVIRSFLRSPAVRIETLALTFKQSHLDNSIIDMLTDCLTFTQCLEIFSAMLTPANIGCIRTILSMAKSCTSLTFADCDGNEDDDEEGPEWPVEPLLEQPTSLTEVTLLSLNRAEPVRRRFLPSFLSGLRTLHIDTLVLCDVMSLLKRTKPGESKISRICVDSLSSISWDVLWDSGGIMDDDPREQFDELLALLPCLQAVEAVLPICRSNGDPFSVAKFPTHLRSISLNYDCAGTLELHEWTQLLNDLNTWLSRCHQLQRIELSISVFAWDNTLDHMEDCNMSDLGSCLELLSADQYATACQELQESHPEALRRYFWESESEINEDMDLDLLDGHDVLFFIEDKLLPLAKEGLACRILEARDQLLRTIGDLGVPYSVEFPDFLPPKAPRSQKTLRQASM